MKTSKIKKGKSITIYLFLFQLKFRPSPKSSESNANIQEDYCQRLFRLKFLVTIFPYDFVMPGSVTSSEILIFSNLKLRSSILVSKSVSSLFEVFMFLRTSCAKLKIRELIIQVLPYWGVCEESLGQPKG